MFTIEGFKSKSPFEATNKEIEMDRLYGGVNFLSEEEEELWDSIPHDLKFNEEYRLKLGAEKFGYNNKK